MRTLDGLACDATDPREGRGWSAPCKRRVVVEIARHLSGDGGLYLMHYCGRHAKRAADRPACVVRQTARPIAREGEEVSG